MATMKPVPPPNPLQYPHTYYPGLDARPWHDPSRFHWIPAVEAEAPRIAVEMSDLLARNAFATVQDFGQLTNSGSWKEFRLYAEGFRCDDACALAPVTMNALGAVPGVDVAGLVACTAVTAGTHIEQHCGQDNARLRCHLGLKIPPECSMRVGDETRTWVENKVIVFDDSFEHEIWNTSAGTRLILIFDLWHPDLSEADIAEIVSARPPRDNAVDFPPGQEP
jgi:aspartyl/asparaginyl beta-hydroxylase (cupin superfamily)